MNKSINLLHNQRKHGFNQSNKILWITASSSLFIIVISSILIFFLKMQSQFPTLQKSENDLLTRLSALQIKVIKYVLFTDRLKDISGIISKRSQLDVKIDEFIPIVPPNININNLSMDRKKMSITVTTLSLSNAERFINNIKDMVDNQKLFSKVNFSGITTSVKKGEYSFSINADLL